LWRRQVIQDTGKKRAFKEKKTFSKRKGFGGSVDPLKCWEPGENFVRRRGNRRRDTPSRQGGDKKAMGGKGKRGRPRALGDGRGKRADFIKKHQKKLGRPENRASVEEKRRRHFTTLRRGGHNAVQRGETKRNGGGLLKGKGDPPLGSNGGNLMLRTIKEKAGKKKQNEERKREPPVPAMNGGGKAHF